MHSRQGRSPLPPPHVFAVRLALEALQLLSTGGRLPGLNPATSVCQRWGPNAVLSYAFAFISVAFRVLFTRPLALAEVVEEPLEQAHITAPTCRGQSYNRDLAHLLSLAAALGRPRRVSRRVSVPALVAQPYSRRRGWGLWCRSLRARMRPPKSSYGPRCSWPAHGQSGGLWPRGLGGREPRPA